MWELYWELCVPVEPFMSVRIAFPLSKKEGNWAKSPATTTTSAEVFHVAQEVSAPVCDGSLSVLNVGSVSSRNPGSGGICMPHALLNGSDVSYYSTIRQQWYSKINGWPYSFDTIYPCFWSYGSPVVSCSSPAVSCGFQTDPLILLQQFTYSHLQIWLMHSIFNYQFLLM